MNVAALLRRHIKAGRKRYAVWARAFDFLRLMTTADGRASLFTAWAYRREIHQTTSYTAENRYPELFDFASQILPDAHRILSFGCSTGEELVALRRRFPTAEIVGVEINGRSRRLACRRTASDPKTHVIRPEDISGSFDAIFALAVFQREPHKIREIATQDLSSWYRFDHFDAAVSELSKRLEPGGILCVINSQYRIEDSSAFAGLEPIWQSPGAPSSFFGPDGRPLADVRAHNVFLKR